jgi:hypothetical protein
VLNPENAVDGRLRLRHLAVLLAVAETRSMQKAALRVHLSQPAVCKIVQEVEESLGCASSSGPGAASWPRRLAMHLRNAHAWSWWI